MFGGDIKMSLSPIQKDIVKAPGNMIVCASAGTGKTHTMVAKIAAELNNNQTHKTIAAITFTVKAAKEIRNRLSIDSTDQFIGTNNSFAIEEIIKPFARDAYGADYDIEMSTDYSIKGQTFEDCLSILKNSKIICSYSDPKKNFVFELALAIAKASRACKLFLKAKYFKLYVDEYQDCDKAMHEFFMYICNNLEIDLFVVGDDKQSIYTWRGAYPEAFKSILEMSNFQKKVLRNNYRSSQTIQNYSNLLYDETRELYKKDEDAASIILIKTTAIRWPTDVLSSLERDKTTALIRFSNNNAREGAAKLNEAGESFVYVPKTPISDISTSVAWLYNAIAQYFILPKYSEYDFLDEIPEESIADNKIIRFIKSQLDKIDIALKSCDEPSTISITKELASHFGYEASDSHIKKMIQTITDTTYHPAFHMDELTHLAITIHSSKGLEFDQVIVFGNDYMLDNIESIDCHYVAVTRAKSKLIVVQQTDMQKSEGERYYRNLQALFAQSHIPLDEVMTIVNANTDNQTGQ
jgi:superfamily I DNA/RNA helicase